MASAAVTANRLMGPVIKPLVFLAAAAPFLKAVTGIGLELSGLGSAGLGANPVEELLNRAGIWALNLLLLTLCVTPLRQLTGLHALGRLRRMLGLFAFFYACLHLTVYVTLDRALELGTIVTDIAKRPYITVGFTAFVLLIPLAVTSFDGLRRRMGQRWNRLHRLVYVIAGLGVVHYLWQVKQDVRNPLLYALVLAVLLGYRAYRAWQRQRQRRAATADGATIPAR